MLNNRKFGIEIEFQTKKTMNQFFGTDELISFLQTETKLKNICTDQRLTKRYGDWKLTGDSSVGGDCRELVSPILSGKRGLDEVKIVLNALRKIGYIDKRQGQHVHVDATDLMGFECVLAALSMDGGNFKNFIPKDRQINANCTPFNIRERKFLLDSLINESSKEYLFSNLSRSHSVNLAALGRHGTIEFRILEGNLDADIAVSWIEIVTSLVEKIKILNCREKLKNIFKEHLEIEKVLELKKLATTESILDLFIQETSTNKKEQEFIKTIWNCCLRSDPKDQFIIIPIDDTNFFPKEMVEKPGKIRIEKSFIKNQGIFSTQIINFKTCVSKILWSPNYSEKFSTFKLADLNEICSKLIEIRSNFTNIKGLEDCMIKDVSKLDLTPEALSVFEERSVLFS